MFISSCPFIIFKIDGLFYIIRYSLLILCIQICVCMYYALSLVIEFKKMFTPLMIDPNWLKSIEKGVRPMH